MSSSDPHNLQRFLTAQEADYHTALSELRRGRKESHWIWYIFPQVAGLGHSSMAQEYAIRSKSEGSAYLQYAILGERLRECAEALLAHESKPIDEITGYPDTLKLKSSMTLFARVSEEDSLFHQVLKEFYDEAMDQRTIEFLEHHA